MLRVLDLFSCVGGHALGLHAAGGFRTVQFVEVDDFRRSILQARFPGVPLHDDVHTFRAAPGSADVIVGGPPCKRTSIGAAIHGRRDGGTLWPEMLRIVEDVSPAWVVVEQPPGAADWEAQVVRDLARVGCGDGYDTARVEFGAGDIGFPHLRRRVFLAAHRDRARLARFVDAIPAAIAHTRRDTYGDVGGHAVPGTLRVADGLSSRLDRSRAAATLRRQRIRAIGDSNPPQMMTVIGRAIVAAAVDLAATAADLAAHETAA